MRGMLPDDRLDAPRRSRLKLGIWLVLGVVALGVALWRWRESHKEGPVASVVEPAPGAQAPERPSAPTVSINDGDRVVRQLGSQLSQAEELTKWLAEDGILRRLVAAVNLIAEGNSPHPVLAFLNPTGKFEVVKDRTHLFASPKSYARYNVLTRVLTSIDVVAAGKAYGQLKPYADAAFSEIGRPGKSFDSALREAIGKLTSTPVPRTEPELQEKGLVYVYADPTLEGLSPAQKHLLRMGADNARAIQVWLKKLQEALPTSS